MFLKSCTQSGGVIQSTELRRVNGRSCFFVPLGIIGALRLGLDPGPALMVGLAIFAVVFAINSAVHSYLVLAYTDEDSVALNVGSTTWRMLGADSSAPYSPASSSSSLGSRVACWVRRRLYSQPRFCRSAFHAGTPYRSWPRMWGLANEQAGKPSRKS